MKTSLAITGVGLLNPVGQMAAECMHSIRSAISGLSLLPYPDRAKEWIAGGRVFRWTSEGGTRRWETLLGVALEQAWRQASAPMSAGPAALILGKPEPERPGKAPVSLASVPPQWTELKGFPAITQIEYLEAGACNAHAALYRAVRLFETSPVRMCIFAVVDSQLDIRTMRWHESNYRLKCSYLADGLMPAEAACVLIIEPQESADARGARTISRILAVAGEREEASVLADLPNTGSALTRAVRTALRDSGVASSDVGMIWSDLNGESYRAREWAFTEIRLGFQTQTQLLHPADCHGDLGAVTDASLLGMAALCHGTGWSGDKPLLVFAGSETGYRGATVLAQGGGGFLQVCTGVPRVLSSSFSLARPVEVDDHTRSPDPPRAFFDWRLREDHRDDLASLHYQRNAILRTGSLPWTRLAGPEQRILNHMDATVASGAKSMGAIAAGLDSDEEGACFAGAFLIGALPARENFAWLTQALQRPTAPRLAGLEAALLHAPSSDRLDEFLASAAEHPAAPVRAMAVRVAGKRRTPIGERILSRLDDASGEVIAAAAEASWRLRLQDCVPLLVKLTRHTDAQVRMAALDSLVVLVPGHTARFCRARIDEDAQFGGHLVRALALAGGPDDAQLMLARIDSGPVGTAAIEALGILGVPASCPRLIELLDSPAEDVKVAAAAALDLMAGTGATEQIPVARDPDDSPSLQERTQTRVNTAPQFWREWWETHSQRLDTNLRWRRGGYHSVGACVAELEYPESRLAVRLRTVMELAVHVEDPVACEPEWFAARQSEAIQSWKSWWVRQQPV